jgi:hypothetical protein
MMAEERWMSNSLIGELHPQGPVWNARLARLYLCACVRALDHPEYRSFLEVVDLAERYTEGKVPPVAMQSMRFTYRYKFMHPGSILLWNDGHNPMDRIQRGLVWLENFDSSREARAIREALWYDLFAPPGIVFDPAWSAWQDGTVPLLANSLRRDRAFEQMPILGDALEDAGCTDAAILDHCRRPGPHSLGCWVLEGLRHVPKIN